MYSQLSSLQGRTSLMLVCTTIARLTTSGLVAPRERRAKRNSGGCTSRRGACAMGAKPVPGADLDALDRRRLRDYLTRVVAGDTPKDRDISGWETLLRNLELMTVSAGQYVATVDGLLLFGKLPDRYVPQSGIRAICYPGVEPDYATRADENLRGALVPLGSEDGLLIEAGLVDQAWAFVGRNTTPRLILKALGVSIGGNIPKRWSGRC